MSAFDLNVCKKWFSKYKTGKKKTQNLMLISNPLKPVCKSFFFSLYLGWTFCIFFNVFELRIEFCVYWYPNRIFTFISSHMGHMVLLSRLQFLFFLWFLFFLLMHCTVYIDKNIAGKFYMHSLSVCHINIFILFLYRSGDDGYQPPGEQPLQPLPVPTVHFQCPEIIRTWIKELTEASAVTLNSAL